MASRVEDGQSVIDTLLNVKYDKQCLRCDIAGFQKIDPSVKNNAEFTIITFLNKYFEEHRYPFKAYYDGKKEPSSISIIKTKEKLHCPVHNVPYITESDLIAHQKCSYESKTEQEQRPANIVTEHVDKETEEQESEGFKKNEELWREIKQEADKMAILQAPLGFQ